jgi:hypothetical protein
MPTFAHHLAQSATPLVMVWAQPTDAMIRLSAPVRGKSKGNEIAGMTIAGILALLM